MPAVTEVPLKAFAHCRDARCDGYRQEEVDAVREETSFTYRDGGGDTNTVFANMVERSTVAYRAVNEDDVPCPVCSRAREVTGDPRPSYQPLSGHDPMGLLGAAPFDPAVRNTESDAKVAELEAKLNRLLAERDV